MRPINRAATSSDFPILRVVLFSFETEHGAARHHLLSGSCERVPIRLSVSPSLRYSLLGSEVAFTKGSTASDVSYRTVPFRAR